MNIKIDTDIPLPKKRNSGLSMAMRKLNIGDSFLMPIEQRTNVMSLALRTGIKITTRKVNGKEIRVWRTE